jgi:hypothetical protein
LASIAAGSQVVTVTVTTGCRAPRLTLQAGNQTRQLTVVVGPPAPGTGRRSSRDRSASCSGRAVAGRLIAARSAGVHAAFALGRAASATPVTVQ